MGSPKRQKPFFFLVAGLVLAYLALCFGWAWSHFENPQTFIPLRHLYGSGMAEVENRLFAENRLHFRPPQPFPTLRLSAEEMHLTATLAESTLDRMAGIRLVVGTYNRRLTDQKMDVAFGFPGGVLRCSTPKPMTLEDNGWSFIRLICPKTPSSTVDLDASLRLKDLKWVEISFPNMPPDARLALYSLRCRGEPATGCEAQRTFATADLLVARYPQDEPPQSFLDAVNYGNQWNSSIHKGLLAVGMVATPAIFAVWLCFLVKGFRTHGPGGHSALRLGLVGGFATWLLLLFSHVWVTPALQNPDEPQHILGLAASYLPPEIQSDFRTALLGVARETKFLASAERPGHPILADHPVEEGLSRSDFTVPPTERSLLYSFVARWSVPQAWKVYLNPGLQNSLSQDVTLYFRVFLMIVPVVLVLVTAAFHIACRGWANAAFLLVCLMNPVSLSLMASISNYVFAIPLGAVTASFLLPYGRAGLRILLLSLGVLASFFLAESARPNFPLVLFLPLVFLGSAAWTGLELGRSLKSWQTLLLLFAVPITLVLVSSAFPEIWLGRIVPSLGNYAQLAFATLEQGLGPRWAGPLAQSFHQALATPRLAFFVSLTGLGGISLGAAQLLARRFPTVHHSRERPALLHATAFDKRWGLTFVFLTIAFFGLTYFVYRFPVPALAPNIYGRSHADFPFAVFLKDCLKATASQIIHFTQDYYLWKTNFLAYGWLDTTAPEGFYFLMRQFWFFGWLSLFVAAFWRPREILFLCVPWALLGIMHWVLLLLGAWHQQHTLLGRYLLPTWGLYALTLVLPCALLYKPLDWRTGIAQLASILGVFLALASLYGLYYMLPQRFAVGG